MENVNIELAKFENLLRTLLNEIQQVGLHRGASILFQRAQFHKKMTKLWYGHFSVKKSKYLNTEIGLDRRNTLFLYKGQNTIILAKRKCIKQPKNVRFTKRTWLLLLHIETFPVANIVNPLMSSAVVINTFKMAMQIKS